MLAVLKKYGFIAIYVLLILLVYLQGGFELIKEPKLRRELNEVSVPKRSIQNWFNGEFQTQSAEYVKRNFGFFNSALLQYNQIDYSVFKKANAKDVVIGKNGFLYEKTYIDAFYGRDLLSDSALNVKTKKLGLIKEYLDSCDVKLFVVMAPGKASFYPEFIPNYYKGAKPLKTNNAEFENRFKKAGIPYINMRDWFLQMKDTASFPLVSQTGIHWSYYGMLLAADSIINYSEQLLSKNLPNLFWTRMGKNFRANKTDSDIEDGMNLFSRLNQQELAYPNYNYESGNFDVAKAVMVGDSYGLGLYQRQLLSRSFKESQFWFYNQRIYEVGKHRDHLKFSNWTSKLTSVDVVFIVVTEATMKKFGFGFIEDSFFEFYPNHVLNRKKKKVVEDWIEYLKSDKNELERMKVKSEKHNLSLEKTLYLEGLYYYQVYYNNTKP
ncbi:MAG: hypothetical protein JXQ87_02100 [Bacteroidia bacterium]